MAHFAKVVSGFVSQVISAEPDFFDTFVDSSAGEWIQTSYNTQSGAHTLGGTPLRMNYAGVGFSYDSERDAFIQPKPFDSWVLDDATCTWVAPTPYPENDLVYGWDEESVLWIEIVEE